jgi:G protein-coupled receptor GPR1
MLLVQSDFIKSLWFVVFPIVNRTRGPIEPDSAFCQLSGFILAVGVEASDVAVLLIAIHSAMYLRRPKSGLYPYRWVALAAYIVIPLWSASIAFVDGPGYTNFGYYCYLRQDKDKRWALLALSWLPRYTLIAFLIVLYVCIYFAVRRRIAHYERRDSVVFSQREASGNTPRTSTHRQSYAGSRSRQASAISDRLRSASFPYNIVSGNETNNFTPDRAAREPIAWKLPGFTHPSSMANDQPIFEERDPFSSNLFASKPPSLEFPSPAYTPPRRSFTAFVPSSPSSIGKAGSPAGEPATTPRSPIYTRLSSFFTRKDTDEESQVPSPTHVSQPTDQGTSNMAHTRDKIRRQLLSLFLYPLVYIILWIFPLANHALGYDSFKDSSQPWLLGLSLISLSIQGLVDCIVFCAREKPWRHTTGIGFWKSVRQVLAGVRAGAGRSREEMLVDERDARARRAGEMVDEVVSGRDTTRKKRHWWDIEEFSFGSNGELEEARSRK